MASSSVSRKKAAPKAAPTTIGNEAVIRGGYLEHPWAPGPLEEVDGKQFFSISKSDRGYAAYNGLDMSKRHPWDDNGILQYLLEKRNAAVADAIKDATAAGADPLFESEAGGEASAKRPKRDCMDETPNLLGLTFPAVTSEDGRELLPAHTMKVQKAARDINLFSFEMTVEEFGLS